MSSQIRLQGSCSSHQEHSTTAGQPAPGDIIQITLVLRRNEPIPAGEQSEPAEFGPAHGADPADILAVEQFAASHSWAVTKVHPAARTVTLNGPLAELAATFEADLEMRQIGAQVFRSRQGHLSLPAELHERVVAVLGFDQRPLASTYHQVHKRASAPASYTPTEVAKFYNFPASTGKGQTIALIELGGGYQDADLQAYWKKLGLQSVSVSAVPVGSAANAPTGDPDSADGEVVLDIDVAGSVAPGAKIAVYFAPNTDEGFLEAINSAIHDTVRKPSVISISWGSAESEWTAQAMNAMNAAFNDAAMLGISVCVASGDNGSSDGEQDRRNHVDFPASSPWVIACGGTRLIGANGKIQSETVWNDGTDGGATGGGASSYFTKPSYQAQIKVPKPTGTKNLSGRGVPDVAGVADPETGYIVLVDGQESVVGGTSAVAPLWAGLIALLNEQLGKNLGYFLPTLYSTLSVESGLHDITSGTNGAYKAGTGWDACTGLGTPNGTAMLGILKQQAVKK